MARSGLYKSDVKRARDALIAQGTNPSIDAVRVALGTGSKTTIHKYLKELEEEEGAAGGTRASISDALQDLVERLAARLHEEAEERIASVRAECESKTAEHAAAVLAAKQENTRMLAHLRETEAALDRQDTAVTAAQESLHRESTARQLAEQQIADLKERLVERETHIQSLEEKHQHARESLEHYRNSVKDQRDADARRHEQQVQQLQAELRQAQQSIVVKQEETSRLNQEGARLVADLGHVRQSLHAEQDRSRRQAVELENLRTIAARHDMLAIQVTEKDSQIQELRQQLATSIEKQDNQHTQIRSLEHQVAQASAQAAAQELLAAKLQALLDGPSKPSNSRQGNGRQG